MKDKTQNRAGGIKKALLITLVSLLCLSVINGCVTVVIYNSFFERHERPDYSVTPGLCYYGRVEDSLPREQMYFTSGDVELCGYYYPCDNPLGLVVFAHGYRAGADDYLALISEIVHSGYALFTYDVRGTYSSGGDSVVGMCQSLLDIDAALDFITSDEKYNDMPIFLIGHSWGGYAVSSVLALHPEVSACVCIAPMADGATVMVEMAEIYAGEIVNVSKPVFDIYQEYLFGEYTNYNAVYGINSTDIPILIAQGVDDDVITMDKLSITAFSDLITNPNVEYYYADGLQGGHSEILYSTEALEYREQISTELSRLTDELGRELTAEEMSEFYSKVDHDLYSDINPELLSLILQTFEKGINS